MEMLMAGSISMGGIVGAMGRSFFVVTVMLLLLDVTLHPINQYTHTLQWK